ncbi:MAG TPA: hypothetical protein ENI97_00495 [Gammaproteobacteria bacterium]|nr:hypothetical protein [Gammaproteobacteria bacterium]
MNMQTAIRPLFAFLMLALFSLSPTYAEEPPVERNLPAGYPSAFQARGIVGGIRSSHEIIVEGSRYALSIKVQVHSPSSRHASIMDLRPGTEIGFSYDRGGNNTRTITEIWVLPPGSIEPS